MLLCLLLPQLFCCCALFCAVLWSSIPPPPQHPRFLQILCVCMGGGYVISWQTIIRKMMHWDKAWCQSCFYVAKLMLIFVHNKVFGWELSDWTSVKHYWSVLHIAGKLWLIAALTSLVLLCQHNVSASGSITISVPFLFLLRALYKPQCKDFNLILWLQWHLQIQVPGSPKTG